MTAEQLEIIITAQNREFNSAINGVINRLDDMGERTRQYGDSATSVFKKVAQAASALGIGKIISDSIMSGGELEQNLGGVEVVFRQHAESMKNTAKNAFKDMGLSESGYLAAANKMGALLKGSGYDIASAAETSQQVMQRASDVASIMGIDVASAMEAVTGAAKGNFTMMDNLGVAINDTTLQIYAQEKGLGKLETTQQKVSAAMQMFLEKTEYAAGNYAKENDTFSGSLTTFKAELENLSAELGTQLLPTATSLLSMARSGLEAVSPLVVSLGEGINQVATFLTNLSPTAKTMLTISLLSAVAIPAVTKAQLLYNAANAKWKDLLNILIPKEITRANVLKATVGWLAIIAGMLALVADIGATAREMNSGEEMQDTADGADKASASVDGLADSYAGLGDSADSAKKSMLDIDTLNVFGGSESSTGIMDFSAAIDGANSAQEAFNEAMNSAGDLEDELNNNFDLSGLYNTFNTTFSDIGIGFDTMWNAIFGSGDKQYQSLLVLEKKVESLFGKEWTAHWENVGTTINKAFGEGGSSYDRSMALYDIQGWLEQIDNTVASWTGEFGKRWSEYWRNIGLTSGTEFLSGFAESVNSIISGGGNLLGTAANVAQDKAVEEATSVKSMKSTSTKFSSYSSLYKDMSDTLVEYLKQGKEAQEALDLTKADYLSDRAVEIYFNEQGYNDQLDYLYAYDLQKLLEQSGQITPVVDTSQYKFADYSDIQQSPASGMGMLSPDELSNRLQQMENGSVINLNLTMQNEIDLDGDKVGESVTTYQSRENARSNGY